MSPNDFLDGEEDGKIFSNRFAESVYDDGYVKPDMSLPLLLLSRGCDKPYTGYMVDKKKRLDNFSASMVN